ncbi:hypothetical protein QO002_002166 [Pararhizobium capsulatum DSM 1112]|uniref:Uncharacterized protein n=1 Tax=Pararhizobium capsulatum DSM 1112 TaxID=1121113 RepID=A0ABU0BP67_9HYPH|nr:hypothetical protein [Pararhizobium capsulatum]MDQ0320028.1 hypothetical protein [Pararhizobium capsulatum DSM 1112]
MNEYSGYTRPVPGGFWAMLRFAKDGQPKPLMGGGARPVVFPTELEATKAVLKATFAYFNGDYKRAGDRCQVPKIAADKLFRKGRMIEVERKARAV